MSDSKLRELERRWRETKSVDDEAAYLRERVRVGDLTQERLELAAYCGHEGARRASGSTKGGDAPLWLWLAGLDDWETEVSLVGLTATICALEELDRRDDSRWSRWLGSAREWQECPCETHAHQLLKEVRAQGEPPALTARAVSRIAANAALAFMKEIDPLPLIKRRIQDWALGQITR